MLRVSTSLSGVVGVLLGDRAAAKSEWLSFDERPSICTSEASQNAR